MNKRHEYTPRSKQPQMEPKPDRRRLWSSALTSTLGTIANKEPLPLLFGSWTSFGVYWQWYVTKGGPMIGQSTQWLLDEDILRCPACVSDPNRSPDNPDPGRLDVVKKTWLVCRDCGRKYPVIDDIPQMLIDIGDLRRNTPVEELL